MLRKFLVTIAVSIFAFTYLPTATSGLRHKEAVEVRKMHPPQLSKLSLGKKIICYRPVREGGPNFTIELNGNKIVAQNYGHGGAGWSLGPGSANYVISQLEKSKLASDLDYNTPITVIGAGVIGLYTSYTLVQKGYKNITIISDRFDPPTSHNAGGNFSPFVTKADRQEDNTLYHIALDSLHFYQDIAKRQNLVFTKGAKILPAYFKNRNTATLEPFVGAGINPPKSVVLDFGNGTKQTMWVYDDGVFIDTGAMMQKLTQHLKKNRVKFVQKHISDLSEISDKYIVNATGLGAAILNDDKAVTPVQGHLILLKKQNPRHFNHLMFVEFDTFENTYGQKVTRAYYLFPKRIPGSSKDQVGVIGGTYIHGATESTPNEQEFDILLQNAKKFYGITHPD